jgi:glycosyltransferase involved in cell wall biosynthesis
MAKISVIMPVYNGEKYVRQSINSLLAQTCADWELIVVNDGSRDRTPEILSAYTDARIQVYHQANAGEAAARNKGLDLARGEYISFLDADDLYLPNALQDLADYMDTHPEFGVVFSDGTIIDENDNPHGTLTGIRPGIYTGDILAQLVLDSSVLTVPVCTISRSLAVRQAGARFDPRLVIGPDWDFWIQMARKVPFGYLDRLTCGYRVHSGNISQTAGWRKRKQDLATGRFKVLDADWFGSLEVDTRRRFFYHLLVDLLEGQSESQLRALRHPQFGALPAALQAQLWRQAGITLLAGDPSQAQVFFRKSLEIQPGDRKTAVLLILARQNPAVIPLLLRFWEKLRGLRGARKPSNTTILQKLLPTKE